MKKITSVILTICIITSFLMVSSVSVLAANYSTDSAMKYAQSHWNDGVGKCAEFVSKCVKAGGLNISTQTGTKGCWDAILKASGLSGKNLTLNSKGYVTKSSNGNILNRGDVVIQWCYTCNLRPHILICGGYDSSGYATFYAHNNPLNNGRYKFSTNSQHKSSCNIGAKVVQLSTLSVKKPTIKMTSYPTSIKKGTRFTIAGTINPNGGTSEIRAYIKDKNGKKTIQSTKTYKTSSLYNYTIGFQTCEDISSQLSFHELSKGTYTFVLTAKNSVGTSTFSKQFKVK